MNCNLLNIKLILFALGSWLNEYGKATALYNGIIDRSTPFHWNNFEKPQMTLLPVYYPNLMLRRMRMQLLPPKKYSHRAILPANYNDIRNNYRYFKFRYLPAPTNGLSNIKWFHPTFPYTNFNTVLKPTTPANYHIITPEQFRNDSPKRDTYFNMPISSTTNYCANSYKLDGLDTHTAAICIEKIPFFPTPLVKMPLSKLKSTTTPPLRFPINTIKPYTQHFLPTKSFLNSINTSNIYFTIGDAITPRTLNKTKIKLNIPELKIPELKNYVTYLPAATSINMKPKTSTVVSELLTLASNPIHLQQKALYYQQPQETPAYYLDEHITRNKSEELYLEDLRATKYFLPTELTINNTQCANFSLNLTNNCVVDILDNNSAPTEVIAMQDTTVPTTLKTLPLAISTVISTVYTPLTTATIENIPTTLQTTEKKAKALKRPTYRRKKIVGVNRRLVFKEKLKGYDVSPIPSTLMTPLRLYETNTKEKRKYISTTFSTPTQTIPSWTRSTVAASTAWTNITPKTTKTKFQIKNRSRWTPKYDKTYRKTKMNVTTSSTRQTLAPKPSSTTDMPTKSSSKINKLRTKINRQQNRRAKILKITTTQNMLDLHKQITTTTTTTTPRTTSSSTPESAIMRISNMNNNGKLTITKNSSANSLISSMPKAGNGFVAELPIVTYFKEVTDPRKM